MCCLSVLPAYAPLGGWQNKRQSDGLSSCRWFAIGREHRVLLGRDDSVVVGHLAVVHRLAVERDRKPLRFRTLAISFWDSQTHPPRYSDYPCVGRWLLSSRRGSGDRQGLVGRETVATIDFLLSVVRSYKRGGGVSVTFSCDLSDRKSRESGAVRAYSRSRCFIIILLQRVGFGA